MVVSVVGGCCWWLVVIVGCSWLLSVVVGCRLLLIVVGCWLLLVVGCCWLLLLVVVGCCWLFLVVVGCCWWLLVVGCCCFCCFSSSAAFSSSSSCSSCSCSVTWLQAVVVGLLVCWLLFSIGCFFGCESLVGWVGLGWLCWLLLVCGWLLVVGLGWVGCFGLVGFVVACQTLRRSGKNISSQREKYFLEARKIPEA